MGSAIYIQDRARLGSSMPDQLGVLVLEDSSLEEADLLLTDKPKKVSVGDTTILLEALGRSDGDIQLTNSVGQCFRFLMVADRFKERNVKLPVSPTGNRNPRLRWLNELKKRAH
jgi:hypothetical protein